MTREEAINKLEYLINSCVGREEIDQTCYELLDYLHTQEPRVMTLDEVLALKFDDVVYVEVVPTHAVLSAIVLDVIPKLPKIGIGVVQFRYAPTWNGINTH